MPAPALNWWHMTQSLSQREGMRRARAVLATTAEGEISGDEHTLKLVTSEFRAVINCIPRGDDRIFTTMIVTGHDGQQTRHILGEIRAGIKGGPLE
jgi:hypothetical protein